MLGLKNALWRLGLVLAIFTVFLALKPPQPVNAVLPEDAAPGEVFTGRFIPAFIGGAYDPSEAYAAMAGLPVYVVAFNEWQGTGAGGDLTWVIGDLAVRTQIRADGTFQVHGLPAATSYGVYFPFTLNNENKVVRTDCIDGDGDGSYRDDFSGDVGDENPCKLSAASTVHNWPFYMPRQEDQLIDIFSYSAKYISSETEGTATTGYQDPNLFLSTQIQLPQANPNDPVRYEKMHLEHVFVTNRKEVDIANNINTFPIAPAFTVKVTLLGNVPPDSTIEFWAMRYSYVSIITGGNLGPITDSPVIRGRFYQSANGLTGSFMAYAPPGEYVVIAWTKELNSPSYTDWNGLEELNTHFSGLAQLSIRPVGTGPIGFVPDNKYSWRKQVGNALGNEYGRLMLKQNAVQFWGIVRDVDGDIFNQAAGKINCNLLVIGGTDCPDRLNAYVTIESANSFSDPDNDLATPNLGFRYYSTGVYDDAGNDSDSKYIDHLNMDNQLVYYNSASPHHSVLAVRGLYMISMEQSYSNLERSDAVTLRLDTSKPDLKKFYNASPQYSGLITSYEGPQRLDLDTSRTLVRANPNEVVTGGHDSGIFLWINHSDGLPAAGGQVSIGVVSPIGDHVQAEQAGQLPLLNELGQLHIPAGLLKPQKMVDYRDLTFWVGIRTRETFEFITVGMNGAYKFSDNNPVGSTNTGLATICKLDAQAGGKNNCEAPYLLTKEDGIDTIPERYNLAALNWLDVKLRPEVASALASEYRYFLFKLVPPGGSEIDFSGEANGDISFENDVLCDEDCGFFKDEAGKEEVSNLVGLTEFYVKVPVPSSMDAKDTSACRLSGGGLAGPGITICDQKYDGGRSVNTLTIAVSASVRDQNGRVGKRRVEYELKVDGAGNLLDASQPISLYLVQDCEDLGDEIAGDDSGFFAKQLKSFFYESACSAGTYMGTVTGKLLNVIQDYVLQTRAFTQDSMIQDMYNFVRNLSNIGFLVIFIVMAVMTALRYKPEQWHTRVILPELLKALVFSNYAVLFAQAMLDLNNFLSGTILDIAGGMLPDARDINGATGFGVGAVTGSVAAFAALASVVVQTAITVVSLIGATGPAGILVFFIVILPVAIGVLGWQLFTLYFAFLLRNLMIWILVLVSPIVFMISVTPWFASLRGKWMGMLTSVSFIQTQVAGMLAVGIILLVNSMSPGTTAFSVIITLIAGIAVIYSASQVPKQAMKKLGMGFDLPSLSADSIRDFRKGRLETREKNKLAQMEQKGEYLARQERKYKDNGNMTPDQIQQQLEHDSRGYDRRQKTMWRPAKFIAKTTGITTLAEAAREAGGGNRFERQEKELRESKAQGAGRVRQNAYQANREYLDHRKSYKESHGGLEPKVTADAVSWIRSWLDNAAADTQLPVIGPDGKRTSYIPDGRTNPMTWREVAFDGGGNKLPLPRVLDNMESLPSPVRNQMKSMAYYAFGGRQSIEESRPK